MIFSLVLNRSISSCLESIINAHKNTKISLPLFLLTVLTSALSAQVNPIRKDTANVSSVLRSQPDTIQPAIRTKSFLNSVVAFPARDSTVVDLVENKIRIYGEGRVTYQGMEITADYIEMSTDKKELLAKGTRDSLGNLISKAVYKDEKDTYETAELRLNSSQRKPMLLKSE